MTRRQFATFALFAARNEEPCSFSVLSLLRPAILRIWPASNARLHCTVGGRGVIIEGRNALNIDAAPARVSGAGGAAVPFEIEIPNVMRRGYFGTLHVTSREGVLSPVVSMDRETAVGSIIGAELPARVAPLEALAAQAVAARTFLFAAKGWRHEDAQFCDTTHCQFLRSPAPLRSVAEHARSLTSRLIVAPSDGYYSAACGVCEVCRAQGLARNGHGLGLCQAGAIGLAKAGWRWQAIIQRYYAGTSIHSI